MVAVKNITQGAKGAYLDGALIMAEPFEIIDADDFNEEWFEPFKAKPAHEAKTEAKAEVKAEAKAPAKK